MNFIKLLRDTFDRIPPAGDCLLCLSVNFENVPHKASFIEQPCGKLLTSCNILVPEFQLADTVKYYFTDVFQAFYKKREK